MWGGARGAGQRDEYFRALDLNAPVAAFAPLGRIGRVRAQPGVSLAALACPGLGAFAPLGRALNAGLAALGFRCGNVAYSVFTSNVRTPQILRLFACHCFRLLVFLPHTLKLLLDPYIIYL